MYFKQTHTIKGLALRTAGAIHFRFDEPDGLTVVLTRKEENKGYDPTQQQVYAQMEGFEANPSGWPTKEELLCIVEMQREPSPKVRELFTKLVGKNLAIREDVSFPVDVDDYRSAPTYVKQASALPEALATFSEQIYREMQDYAVKILRVLRWRVNATSRHNLLHGFTSTFSFDNKTWLLLPISPGFYF